MRNPVGIRFAAVVLVAGASLLPAQPADTASASGVTVQIPSGWHWNQAIAQSGGPLSLTTFERWRSGGVPPAEGAEIDITRVPAPRNLQEYVQREIAGSESEAPVEAPVQKNPAMQVSFTDSYGDLKLSTRAIYVLHGAVMYKLYLTFHTGDAHAADFTAAFEALARQARFE